MYKVNGDTVAFAFAAKDAKPTDTVTHSQHLRYACRPDTVDLWERTERKRLGALNA